MAKRRKIEVSLCAWIDLLGYGSMLKESGFDPSVELAQKAIERLEIFHQTASKHANRRFNIFAINDGLICSMDLSTKSSKVTMEFFKRVVELHQAINKVDLENGFYGARTIVATGFRVRKVNSVTVQSGIKDILLDKIKTNRIKINEAIHMAIKARPHFGIIPELQANFAFTKSYLVDSEGSAGGFKGPNCFIDLSIFTQPMPEFIKFSKYINWNNHGLQAKFGELESIDLKTMESLKGKGFLDSKGVGENITNSPEVFKRISKITKETMKAKNK